MKDEDLSPIEIVDLATLENAIADVYYHESMGFGDRGCGQDPTNRQTASGRPL
jgi:hypothetical protein